MKAYTLKEIAARVSGTVVGDPELTVDHPAGLAEAGAGALTFLANPSYAPLLQQTKATAVIVGRNVAQASCVLIQVDNPDLAFAQAMIMLAPPLSPPAPGIQATAVVSAAAKLGQDVFVGDGVVVAADAAVGDRAVLYPGVYVGENTVVGADCILHPGVVLYHDVVLGERVVIHANSVVGADGFGYAWDGSRHLKIPQVGTVEIAADVEIGSCTVIDRARFGKTVIGPGTKLDNLIQIGHNVRLGAHCAFAAQVGVSGSTIFGSGVLAGGQSGFAGHLEIAAAAQIAARAGVTKDVPETDVYIGYPARPLRQQLDEWRHLKSLPRLRQTVRRLEKEMAELKARLEAGKDT